jgi:hypothetical protein
VHEVEGVVEVGQAAVAALLLLGAAGRQQPEEGPGEHLQRALP